MDKTAFEESIKFKLKQKNILITFHPVTLENETDKNKIYKAISDFNSIHNINLLEKLLVKVSDCKSYEQLYLFINENELKMMQFLSKVKVQRIPIKNDKKQLFKNINSFDELTELNTNFIQ